jgi:exopolysaccharide/PEP-CTERM locus tyrosine autokinase
MNLIEQAARRLEELRRAGVEVPQPTADARESAPPAIGARRGKADAPGQRDARRNPAPVDKPAKEVVIDLDRLAAMGYITPKGSRSLLADEYRVLKRPMLNNVQGTSAAPAERANLIMVTSSLPGEGKTFTSINLAISMSLELDCHVLLVDADVARPAVLDRLGLPPSPGLLDLLTDPALSVSDVLLRTNIERLTVMPAGPHNPHATELLASDGMSALLDELSTRYADRIIIFDAPPLLASTESRVLATRMGQVVVVVEAGKTPQHAVAESMAALESCPIVMPMLNKASDSQVGSYYGGYGGYGAGYDS